MGDPLETELKLELDPADLVKLDLGALTLAGEDDPERQVSRYFDTPDLDLQRAGFSLRIRQVDGRFVQTVKRSASSTAGLFVRNEWEQPTSHRSPRMHELAGPLSRVFDAEALKRLKPLFTIQVERLTRKLQMNGSAILFTLDQGMIKTSKQKEPICEIELELAAGNVADLFGLAREIDKQVPLELGVEAKSERGYNLLAPEPRGSFKAEAIAIEAQQPAADAFAAIAESCIRQFRRNEKLLLKDNQVDPLHQARVGLRRLRSAFSAFAPLISVDERADLFNAELRWLARVLGDVRDLDVLIPSLTSTTQKKLIEARERAMAQAREQLCSARTRLLMLDLAEWLAIGAWRLHPADAAFLQRPVAEVAHDILRKQRRRLSKRGENLRHLSDEHRHEVRKQAKRLRYTAEFFAGLYPDGTTHHRYKKFLSALEKLQDHLGALNDIATLPVIFARYDVEPPDTASHKKDRAHELKRAEKAFKMLRDAEPFW